MKRLSRREFVKWSAVAGAAMSPSLLAQAGSPSNSPAAPETPVSHDGQVGEAQKQIALLHYPGITALDLIAPQMIFALLPGRQVHLVAKTLQPDLTLEDTPERLEVLFVPGGLVG